jgi:hypothetical protein
VNGDLPPGRKSKKGRKKAQVLSDLNANLFDFFDFVVKKFCGPSLGPV